LLLAIDRELGGNKDFYNLPRKFKMSVTGCSSWCSYSGNYDVAFTATTRFEGRQRSRFQAFASQAGFPPSRICRQAECFPFVRTGARCRRGVAADLPRQRSFAAESRQARLKYALSRALAAQPRVPCRTRAPDRICAGSAESEEIPADIPATITVSTDRNRVGFTTLARPPAWPYYASAAPHVAELAEIHGDGHVRLTVQQNILLINISSTRESSHQRVEPGRPARGRICLRPRHRRLHGLRILQARAHGD